MEAIAPNGQAGSAPQSANPAALAASANVLGSVAGPGGTRGGVLYGIRFTNTNAAVRYLQVFDAQTLPADAAVPVISLAVAAAGDREVTFGLHGKAFKLGCFICTSSTQATKTIGPADALIEATFKQG